MHIVKPALSDKFLFEEIIKLKNLYSISTFVETGAHVGGSAKIASDYFKNVITCENNEYYYKIAKNETAIKTNIDLLFCNSTDLLNTLIESDEFYIIFLDAHAENDFPLKNELNIISKFKVKPIIIIHDFYVPDENDNAKFSFDNFSGQNLDLNYIWDDLIAIYGNIENFKYYYLNNQELSGVIYIMPN